MPCEMAVSIKPNPQMLPLKNLACTLSALTPGACGIAAAQPRSPSAPFDFKGRFLVSISDADMIPSAYTNGKLGPVDGADALSVIRLDLRKWERADWKRAQAPLFQSPFSAR